MKDSMEEDQGKDQNWDGKKHEFGFLFAAQ
jgi:hypothetical protein